MHSEPTLEDLGYQSDLEQFRISNNLQEFDPARVIAEHKERYIVKNNTGEYEAEVLGIIRFNAETRSDFPAVGDWVAIKTFDQKFAIIHRIFPRKTVLERRAVGKHAEKQIIASNIDVAYIMQSLDRDFNINRIERYLALCNSTNIESIILLSKADLLHPEVIEERKKTIRNRIGNISIMSLSNQTLYGYGRLRTTLKSGKTYCLLGSSGVGKSTLINNLIGNQKFRTAEISLSTAKGKHTTSHRELILLEQGGMIIDNPGMREVGIANNEEGLEITFDRIIELADDCRFADCTHIHEEGCAVKEAVEKDSLDRTYYLNYLRMEREKEHFKATEIEKRRKDKKFGKMVKEVMRIRRQNN